MTVVLNEAALRRLLTDPSGPVGDDLRRRAETVEELARSNASGAVIGIRTGDLIGGIQSEVREGEDGLEAVVRTPAEHGGFFYPAFHDQNGRPWLTEALRDGFDA